MFDGLRTLSVMRICNQSSWVRFNHRSRPTLFGAWVFLIVSRKGLDDFLNHSVWGNQRGSADTGLDQSDLDGRGWSLSGWIEFTCVFQSDARGFIHSKIVFLWINWI
ncbi:hypothetical protein NPIL_118051 [Nephila pilipes]|uniref:Uncharacterized protein n=1 Tax=Nephila pilipes TaxID=299642 RepID=A0A8X6MRU9_NEPPI|nr:hypothetical protein NPIL_118051 [Nephila pilipes]